MPFKQVWYICVAVTFFNYFSQSQTLRKSWDQEKTLKQNLQILGLAFDANSAVPIPKSKTKVSAHHFSLFLMCYMNKNYVSKNMSHLYTLYMLSWNDNYLLNDTCVVFIVISVICLSMCR